VELACQDKINQLTKKGVRILNPFSIDIGPEVSIDRISGNNVTIYPGCRIYGQDTIISAHVQLGEEGVATVDNCRIGSGVALKSGYFRRSVFLQGASLAMGAHVREGCLIEEYASASHCAGLKQTILFPFVTLGSLINFCDCMMTGGTGPGNHSEVGSSFIHFNFTPEGDKTTASLIGDVPRGVMLNQPPIFLGGQGGLVGPVRIGFGNVTAAGTILRNDIPESNKLISGKSLKNLVLDHKPGRYAGILRILENNIYYVANLQALEQWYQYVRQPFFKSCEFGDEILQGALSVLKAAGAERIKRLRAMAHNISKIASKISLSGTDARIRFCENIQALSQAMEAPADPAVGESDRKSFMNAMEDRLQNEDTNYIRSIQELSSDAIFHGTRWLDTVVWNYCRTASAALPELNLFQNWKTMTEPADD